MNIILCLILLLICLWCTFTDLEQRVIPNKITHWAIIILLIIRLPDPQYYFGLVPAAALFILWYCSPNSLGAGDVKLFAVIGLCIGLISTFTVFFWTMVIFCITAAVIRAIKGELVVALPLAPMITAGVCIALFTMI